MEPRITRKKITGFSTLGELLAETVRRTLQPPQRLTVDDWAEQDRYVNQPGAYVGPWRNDTTPYMTEPMHELTSRDHSGLVFVGSAQTGKTDALIVNNIGYTVTCDPMDMLIISPSTFLSRDFSIRRLDRLGRDTKSVGEALIKKRDTDNKFDKQYKNGTMVSLGWPSAGQLAGRPIGRVCLTDYDRMDDDIEGEGSPFDLAVKRTTTFGSFAMTVAESTPSREMDPENLKRVLVGNEAPPVGGVFELYNRGDRRRWHWPCPECGSYFEGKFEMLHWETLGSSTESAESAKMECPHCEHMIPFGERQGMNERGIWLKDGQRVEDDWIVGTPRRSTIASFWVRGVAAAFSTWARLVEKYLNAEESYQNNGAEEALKSFYNTDLGEVYIPKAYEVDKERTADDLIARAYDFPFVADGEPDEDALIDRLTAHEQGYPRKLTPLVTPEMRGLFATIDVQKNLFVAAVWAVCEGNPYDLKLLDRFQLRKSLRVDEDGERKWVKPGSYLQDWDLIEDAILRKTYPIQDDHRRMGVHMALCDSGGKAGVTTNAYNFVREMRKRGMMTRFHLVKGDATPNAPRSRVTYPDSGRNGSKAGARGDIPVLMLNPNMGKDTINNLLEVTTPGQGMIHLPQWMHRAVFDELVAERRTLKGWDKKGKSPNEMWDLTYYAVGACFSAVLNVEKVNWNSPPKWLQGRDDNPNVFSTVEDETFAKKSSGYDFSALGKNLA